MSAAAALPVAGIRAALAVLALSFVTGFATPTRAAIISAATLGERIELEAIPSFAARAGAQRFVIGFAEDGGSTLKVLNADVDAERPAFKELARLSFSISDGMVDAAGRTLIAVGVSDGSVRVASIDLHTGMASEHEVDLSLANPLIAVDAEGAIRLADKGLGRIYLLDGPIFAEGAEKARVRRTLYFDASRGIGEFFVTAGGEFSFVADRAKPRLSVLDASGQMRDTIGSGSNTKSSHPTVPATFSFHDGSAGVDAPVSLLMANYNDESLKIVDFEPVLQTMSVTSTASIAVPVLPNSYIRAAPIGGAALSPIVLGASPDQQTIVVGNSFSKRLLFFSRRGPLLERTGVADLATPPSAILVSEDGRRVVVLHDNAAYLRLLDLGQPDETASFARSKLDPGGAKAVREVQRALRELGFPVGAVDGYAGPRTMQSLEAVKKSTGRALDIGKPEEAIKVLRSMESRF